MKNMNVFATEDELEDIKERAGKARETPIIGLGPFNSFDPWQFVREKIHEYALAHGLPDTPGFYGIHLKTGEFLSQY